MYMATTKQKIAAKKLSENIRKQGQKKPMQEILKESGYSESVSKSPQRVTESKGWKELMEEYFPAENIYRIHKKLLNKKEIIAYKGEFIKTRQPHSDVKYALDMIYKLKGLYKENEFSVSISNATDSMSMEELDEEIEHLEKQCRYQYIKEKRLHS
jgi:hypothetical protein